MQFFSSVQTETVLRHREKKINEILFDGMKLPHYRTKISLDSFYQTVLFLCNKCVYEKTVTVFWLRRTLIKRIITSCTIRQYEQRMFKYTVDHWLFKVTWKEKGTEVWLDSRKALHRYDITLLHRYTSVAIRLTPRLPGEETGSRNTTWIRVHSFPILSWTWLVPGLALLCLLSTQLNALSCYHFIGWLVICVNKYLNLYMVWIMELGGVRLPAKLFETQRGSSKRYSTFCLQFVFINLLH